jgi:hypothetical protein
MSCSSPPRPAARRLEPCRTLAATFPPGAPLDQWHLHLAYTQVADKADPDWSRVCSAAEIAGVVENEYLAGRDDGEEDAARKWVSRRFSGRFGLVRRDGLLQATLPASAFGGAPGDGSGVPLSKLGSFVMMNTWFFRLWCDDVTLRRRALLERSPTRADLRCAPRKAWRSDGRLDIVTAELAGDHPEWAGVRAMLIRPDGYIAWATHAEDAPPLATWLSNASFRVPQ